MGIFFIAAVFWVAGFFRLDPDFGWHYQLGKHVLQEGRVPKIDPFSYTMPSFPFVDHEWLTNLGLAVGYDTIGFGGLAILFALIATVALFLVINRHDWQFFVIPVFLGVSVLWNRAGIRPQVLSWVFFALVLKIFADANWRKWRWSLPILFLFWSNMHGSVVWGVGVVGFFSLVKFFRQKRIVFIDLLIGIFVVLATFITPYGYRIWTEVWMQMSDKNLPKFIQEWQPIYKYLEFGTMMILAFSAALVWIWKRRLSAEQLGLFLVTLIMSCLSVRHAAFFVLVAIWVSGSILKHFADEMNNNSVAKHRMNVFGGILVGVALVIDLQASWNFIQTIGQGRFFGYPVEAVNFLKNQNIQGNLFAAYQWGGYLIWQYPERKMFIDGRMPSWREGSWSQWRANAAESQYAMWDYLSIRNGNSRQLFDKFNIRRVLWPVVSEESWKDRFWKRIGVYPAADIEQFSSYLLQNGWIEEYKDSEAQIFVRE